MGDFQYTCTKCGSKMKIGYSDTCGVCRRCGTRFYMSQMSFAQRNAGYGTKSISSVFVGVGKVLLIASVAGGLVGLTYMGYFGLI